MAKETDKNNITRDAVIMVVISILGASIGFAFSVFLGRILGPQGFQDYAVAIASLTLLGTVCEMGTGKYAMRMNPEYIDRKAWGLASGFLRYSVVLVLCSSLMAGLVAIGLETGFAWNPGRYPTGFAMLFLPTTALVAVATELIMANRAAIAGSLVIRVICPLVSFGLLLFFYWGQGPVESTTAILCFGVGGIVGLVVAIFLFFRTSTTEAVTSPPEYKFLEWTRNCLWYAVLAFLISGIFRISVIVLNAINIADVEVSQFAAALETASFVLLIAKSTNKFYQPELALIISQNDWVIGGRLRRNRILLIGFASLAYFIGMVLFGKQILGWFGPGFVDGYLSLCFISAGTCVATTFSMAPEYLKFAEKLRTVLVVNCVAGVSLIVLTWILAVPYGATGAGVAFAIVVITTALTFWWIASRHWQMQVDNLE